MRQEGQLDIRPSIVVAGIPVITLEDAALFFGLSVMGVRNLCNNGNQVRLLSYIRYQNTMYIPESEVKGFPLTNPGRRFDKGIDIYHVGGNGLRSYCPLCSKGEKCENALLAEEDRKKVEALQREALQREALQ